MYSSLYTSPQKIDCPKDLISSVQRSLSILEFIAESPQGVNIKQISLTLNLNISTCYHLTNTLISCGYIVKDSDNSVFLLSGKIGYSRYEQVAPSRLARLLDSYVKSLREITNETTYASIWDGGEIYVASISEGPRSVRVNALDLGFCEANHAIALGKAILAYWDENQLQDFISNHPLISYTEKTITCIELLEHNLEIVRKNGYSLDAEEYFSDVFCLGAPIFDAEGKVLASIAIALPGSRYRKTGDVLLPDIINTAQAASRMMRIMDFRGVRHKLKP
jgi:IclR family acetate operon transcriptional repressor